MGKKAARSKKKSKRPAIKDLPAAEASTRNVKGGFLGSIGKAIGGVVKSVGPIA